MNERGAIISGTTEIQRVIRSYYEQLYANKLDSLQEMGTYLETCNLPRLNQGEIENLNTLITSKVIESNKKKSSNKENPRTRRLHW